MVELGFNYWCLLNLRWHGFLLCEAAKTRANARLRLLSYKTYVPMGQCVYKKKQAYLLENIFKHLMLCDLLIFF